MAKNKHQQLKNSRNNTTGPSVRPKQVAKPTEEERPASKVPEAEQQPPGASTVDSEKKRPHSMMSDSPFGSEGHAAKKQHAGSSSGGSITEGEEQEAGDLEALIAEKDILMKNASSLLGATDEGRVLVSKLNELFSKTHDFVRFRTSCTHNVEKMKRKIREAVLQEVKEDRELELLSRTVTIQGILRLKDTYLDGQAPLEDIITDVINNITRARVTVLSCRVWRSAEDNKPKSASVVLGSRQQKDALYRYVATHMRLKTEWHQFLQGMSFRDTVPREYMAEAQALLKKGAEMKHKGHINGYKIKTVGYHCLPALVIRSRQRGWHISEVTPRRLPASDGGREEDLEEMEGEEGSYNRSEAAGFSQGEEDPRGRKREQQIREHERREDSIKRLRKRSSEDPDAYLHRLEYEEQRASRTASGYYDLKVKFLESMQGTAWMAERDKREEENYAESY